MIMMGDDKKKALVSILGPKEKEEEAEPNYLHAVSQELLSAIESKDVEAVADCLAAAFQECESRPHAEGPQED